MSRPLGLRPGDLAWASKSRGGVPPLSGRSLPRSDNARGRSFHLRARLTQRFETACRADPSTDQFIGPDVSERPLPDLMRRSRGRRQFGGLGSPRTCQGLARLFASAHGKRLERRPRVSRAGARGCRDQSLADPWQSSDPPTPQTMSLSRVGTSESSRSRRKQRSAISSRRCRRTATSG